MGRSVWNTVRKSRGFYIHYYRRMSQWIMVSLLINLLLSLAIYYAFMDESPRSVYATSGIAPPVQLKPLDAPNYTDNYLLEPEPHDEDESRLIPQ